MTSDLGGGAHAVASALADSRLLLAGVAETPMWSMGPTATREALADARALLSQAAELEARLLLHAAAVGVPEEKGASSLGSWLMASQHITRPEANARVRLAESLETYAVLRAAVAAGEVEPAKAVVVGAWLDSLPDDLDLELGAQAEKELVSLAPFHSVTELKHLGKAVLELLAPQVAEEHEANALARAEAQAWEAIRLTTSRDGEGRTYGRFTLPDHVAAMLRDQLLEVLEGGSPGTSPRRMGEAFATWIERGADPHVVVTMPLETLLGGIAGATMSSGDRISAGEARRLACQAGIIPAVLGGKSEVLDLGIRRRYFSRKQRTAHMVRFTHCQSAGCDRPASRSDMHHLEPWSLGGPTDLANAALLCPHHHRRIHDDRYSAQVDAAGVVNFNRRQ